jgi:tellurite methyltransferase
MADEQRLSTAHEAWEQRWTDEGIRRDWITPEALVIESVPFLRKRGVRAVLDIGCGLGRHALYLAQQGFDVTGVDLSEAGLDIARDAAAAAGVAIDYRIADFTNLPASDGSIDLAVAWNVIYHGDEEIARTALQEIRRVLKPDGLFLGTMISKRHERYGVGVEIRPNTFVDRDDDEKSHPHFYCNDRELINLLDGFQIYRLQDREQLEDGAWHWEFLAETAAAT